jgi:hypothetical protein
MQRQRVHQDGVKGGYRHHVQPCTKTHGRLLPNMEVPLSTNALQGQLERDAADLLAQ